MIEDGASVRQWLHVRIQQVRAERLRLQALLRRIEREPGPIGITAHQHTDATANSTRPPTREGHYRARINRVLRHSNTLQRRSHDLVKSATVISQVSEQPLKGGSSEVPPA